MKKIYLYQKELEDLNINLENKVIDRTTDLKKTNEQLIEAKILAESASKAKDIFLANISHELKTPMNAILGYSSLAIRRIDKIDKIKEKYYFEQINDSGKRLMKLLEDLIDIAKLETLNVKYNFENADLLLILKESINNMIYKTKEKKINIAIHTNESLDYSINIDSIKIRQVIDNLLTNAVKFTKENTSINIDLIKKENSILAKFEDQGVGVNNNELLKIFESFYQSPKTSNTEAKGTGLGLSISQKIISAHNGEIWAFNRLDGEEGAVFCFEIPLNLG
jgi:signal transduction histidine kinase